MRVPGYEQKQVEQKPYSAVLGGAPPVAPTEGLARGLQDVSKTLFDVAAMEQKKADSKALLDFRVSLDNKETALAYGDDENEGFLNLRGEDAPKTMEAYLDDFKSHVEEAKKGAQNDAQRQAFDAMAAERLRTVERQFRTHASAQFQNAVDASQEAFEKSTLRNIGNYYRDDERFSQELAVGRAAIMADVDNKGLPPEVAKFRLDTFTSAAFGQRIERLAQESPTEAKKFLAENKDLMTATDVAKFEKELAPLATKELGMSTALQLAGSFNTAMTPAELWVARDKALAEARTSLAKNPDALNLAETQLRQMASEREQGITIAKAQALEPVYGAMVKVREAGRIPSLGDIDPKVWANLQARDPEKAAEILKAMQTEVRAASEHAESVAAARESRAAARESRQYTRELRAQAKMQKANFADLYANPDALLSADINGLVATAGLTPEQGKTLEERRKSASQDTLFTETQEIKRVLQAGKLKEKSEDYDAAIEYVARAKAVFQADNKRTPKASEVAAMAREALLKVDAAGTIFDKPAYKMTLEDVPKDHRAAIVSARQKRHLPTTEADVVSTYVHQQQRKKGGK